MLDRKGARRELPLHAPRYPDFWVPVRRKLGALRCSTPSSLRHSARATISRDYCTVVLTVAELLARLGSGVSSVAVAFSLITVPEGAVTFTIRRTVQVVFGAMALFS